MEDMKKRSFALGYSYIGHSFVSYMFLAFVLVSISNNVLPGFYDTIPAGFADAMGGADSAMLLINTLCAVFSAVVGIFIGQWVERKGPKQAIIAGYIVGGINYFIFPFAGRAGLVSLIICLAVTHTAMFAYCQMTSQSLIAHWFNKKKGMALGLSAVGIPAGNAVFSLIYTNIVSSLTVDGDESIAIRTALWLFGTGLVVMGILSIFWVKNSPFEVGLTPDNLPVESIGRDIKNRSYHFREIIRTPYVWLIIVIYGLLNCAVIACVAQLMQYIIARAHLGSNTTAAGAIMSVGALAGIAGGFAISFMDQKLGTRRTTIIYCIVSVIVYLAMAFVNVSNIVVITILCMLAFLLNGAPAPLMPSMILSLFGPESFNSVSKIATPIGCVARSCGYYVVALFMFEIKGLDIWASVYTGLALMAAISLVLVILCRRKHVDIAVTGENTDIFSVGNVYFGFDMQFQNDLRRVKELIYGRGNTGRFVDGKVPEGDIREIVEAGTYVPENIPIRPWHFVAVSDDGILKELSGKMHDGVVPFAAKLRERFPGHPEFKRDTEEFLASLDSASFIVMAFTDYHVEPDELSAQILEIGSAFQNMLIKAYGKGIGSYWLTSPIAAGAAPKLKEQFSPDMDGEFIGMITFGYYGPEGTRPVVKKGRAEYII